MYQAAVVAASELDLMPKSPTKFIITRMATSL